MAKDGAFKSQSTLRGAAMITEGPMIDYADDNLFAGVWRLNQDNLNRFTNFLSGYAFICWVKSCRFIETINAQYWKNFKALTERNFKAFSGIQDFTLDSDNLTIGFAGNDLPVPTNLKKDITSFSLRHYELAGSPIRELYQFWITGIRDPETGLAHYHGLINSDNTFYYSLRNHTAELLYVVTDPSGARDKEAGDPKDFTAGGRYDFGYLGIEFSCLFTNSFPTKVPQEHLNYTSGEHSIPEIDIDFKGCYHQSWEINELAKEVMKDYSIKRMFGDYTNATDPTSLKAVHEKGYNEKAEDVA